MGSFGFPRSTSNGMKGMTLFWLAVAILVVVGVGAGVYLKSRPGALDGFTQCLSDRGAVFYGAFWCPHCQKVKRMFGNSAKLLPYIECSTADGRGQLPVCKDKSIEQYPTWEFTDGSRLVGESSLQELAEKTGCELPALE